MWHAMNYTNIFEYSDDIIHLLYQITATIKFIFFRNNSIEIVAIMDEISGMMTTKTKMKALNAEKIFRRITLCVLISTGTLYGSFCILKAYFTDSILTLSHNRYFFNVSFFPVFGITTTISFFGIMVVAISNLALQSYYFNFSIHICLLFRQLHDELKFLNEVQDTKRVQKIIQRSARFHVKIMNIISKLVDNFDAILTCNFINDTIALGFTILMFSDMKNIVKIIIYFPYILFDVWMFCFASWMISDMVKICIH